MKRLIILLILLLGIWFFFWTKKGDVIKNTALSYVLPVSNINENGSDIISRLKIPEGFKRDTAVAGSFQNYIQEFPLKVYGSKVINYDGEPYMYQQGHVGVLEISVPSNGLQQCADALMRLRADYLWNKNRKDEIGFKFTSGHYCSWKKYSEGYRPKVDGNKVSFHKTASANNSKENFYKYLNLIYTYAGTQSLFAELPSIDKISELKIGDMIIKPGFPGHVVMIADIIQNVSGERLFALIQGNTPAQSVHLLKNPKNTSVSPWFTLRVGASLQIPTYYFKEARFMRFL